MHAVSSPPSVDYYSILLAQLEPLGGCLRREELKHFLNISDGQINSRILNRALVHFRYHQTDYFPRFQFDEKGREVKTLVLLLLEQFPREFPDVALVSFFVMPVSFKNNTISSAGEYIHSLSSATYDTSSLAHLIRQVQRFSRQVQRA